MSNPYDAKSPAQFWRTAVADLPPRAVRPVPVKRFHMAKAARVATAGSCFAQNVAKLLIQLPDVELLQTESFSRGQPVFSARFGNIYTVRQLWQLFQEATGHAPQSDLVWQRPDGRWVDALRPAMFAGGFASPGEMMAARAAHLAAVRRVFAECSVFVFTLGLTEAWIAAHSGAVVPVAPGVVADDPSGAGYRFHNFSYAEILSDLTAFHDGLKKLNPAVRILLTVSPVPLVATYTDEHVLNATSHSKAILRAICAAAEAAWPDVYYFPSYEIISAHYNAGSYYEANKRSVTAAGIEHVMDVFQQTYFGAEAAPHPATDRQAMLAEAYQGADSVICDEELIAKSVGF